MGRKYFITEKDAEEIRAYRKNVLNDYLDRRLFVIQLLGEGKTSREIEKYFGVSRAEVTNWARKYCTKGGIIGLAGKRKYSANNIKAEAHFWFSPEYPKDNTYHAYSISKSALNDSCQQCVHTTQFTLCTTDLFEIRRIFIHPCVGNMFEISLGITNPSGRHIRKGLNLWRLLLAGEFDWKDKETGEEVNVTGD